MSQSYDFGGWTYQGGYDNAGTYPIADGGGVPDIQVIGQGNGQGGATAGGGGGSTAGGGKSAQDLYWEQRAAADAAAIQAQKDATAAVVKAAFDMYGLSSLYPKIVQFAQSGMSADAILLQLRQTDEYKARFPAMAALNQKGRAITEAQYVDYERTAANIESRYGFANGLITGAVTDLLTNEVSAAELADRAQIAAADSITAPQDLRTKLADWYHIDPDTALRSYYLDPEKSIPVLEKQSAAARIGAWADRQAVTGVDAALAEQLYGIGVTEADAQAGFGRVAAQQGLTAGRGDVVSNSELIQGNLAGDAQAQLDMQRAASARGNRFAGGGQFAGDRGGATGIGTATR